MKNSNNAIEQEPISLNNQEKITIEQEKEPRTVCFWCNNESPKEKELYTINLNRKKKDSINTVSVCSKEHEQKIRRFYLFIDNWIILFQLLTIIIPLGLLIFIIIRSSLIAMLFIFVSIGLGLIFFPLLGKKITNELGLHKTNILGRILGVMIIFTGCALFLILVLTLSST
jgi:uncharacterized protein YjeT (DUF2065 family)